MKRSLEERRSDASFLVVVIVAICALDIVSDEVPASDNLADHEEDVRFGGDEAGVEVLGLCDISPGLCLACVPDELQGSVLGGLDLGTRGRGHTLADVNLLGNLACDLGIVQDGSCCKKAFQVRSEDSVNCVFYSGWVLVVSCIQGGSKRRTVVCFGKGIRGRQGCV